MECSKFESEGPPLFSDRSDVKIYNDSRSYACSTDFADIANSRPNYLGLISAESNRLLDTPNTPTYYQIWRIFIIHADFSFYGSSDELDLLVVHRQELSST